MLIAKIFLCRSSPIQRHERGVSFLTLSANQKIFLVVRHEVGSAGAPTSLQRVWCGQKNGARFMGGTRDLALSSNWWHDRVVGCHSGLGEH